MGKITWGISINPRSHEDQIQLNQPGPKHPRVPACTLQRLLLVWRLGQEELEAEVCHGLACE